MQYAVPSATDCWGISTVKVSWLALDVGGTRKCTSTQITK